MPVLVPAIQACGTHEFLANSNAAVVPIRPEYDRL